MTHLLTQFLFLNLLAFSSEHLSTASCQDQLQNSNWPTDCLLAVKLSRSKVRSKMYSQLNTWCFLNSEILSKKPLPVVFLSLNPPNKCKEQAENKLKHDKAVEILEGRFFEFFSID